MSLKISHIDLNPKPLPKGMVGGGDFLVVPLLYNRRHLNSSKSRVVRPTGFVTSVGSDFVNTVVLCKYGARRWPNVTAEHRSNECTRYRRERFETDFVVFFVVILISKTHCTTNERLDCTSETR